MQVLSLREAMASTAKKSPKEVWEMLLPVFAFCNLHNAKKNGLLREAEDGECEVGINLDQDVLYTPHVGKQLPVILASISHMWGTKRGRPFTGKELLQQKKGNGF